MKRIKYIMLLIVALCIGISNIERVSNLIAIHATQTDVEKAYNKYCSRAQSIDERRKKPKILQCNPL